MAILKQRLLREGTSGTFDTIHLETQSGLVIMPDGSNLDQIVEALQTAIAAKASASHTHTPSSIGAAAAEHTHSQYLTSHQSLSGYVPTSRTINGKKLTSNITLTASDVSAAASDHSHAGGISLQSIVTGTLTTSATSITIPAVNDITLCLILWKNGAANSTYRYNSILLPYVRPSILTANTIHWLPSIISFSSQTGKLHPCSKLGARYKDKLVSVHRVSEGSSTSLSDQGGPSSVEVYGI